MDVTRTEVTWPLLYSVTQRDMFVLWKYKKCWYILEQVVQFIKIDVHVSFLFKDKISWPINFEFSNTKCLKYGCGAKQI